MKKHCASALEVSTILKKAYDLYAQKHYQVASSTLIPFFNKSIEADDTAIIEAVFLLGKIHIAREDYFSAKEVLKEALPLLEKNANNHLNPYVHLYFGYVQEKIGNSAESIVPLKKALELFEARQTPNNETKTKSSCALASFYLGNALREELHFDEALLYLQKCAMLNQDLKKQEDLLRTKLQIAICHILKKDYSHALPILEEIASEFINSKEHNSVITTLQYQGLCYLKTRKYRQGIEVLRSAEKYYNQSDDRDLSDKPTIIFLLALCHFKNNNDATAEKLIAETLSLLNANTLTKEELKKAYNLIQFVMGDELSNLGEASFPRTRILRNIKVKLEEFFSAAQAPQQQATIRP